MVFYFFPHGKHWDHVRTSFNHNKQPFLKLPPPPQTKKLLFSSSLTFLQRCRGNEKTPLLGGDFCRARDEVRTRDIHLGKVVLYQLSYSRNFGAKNYGLMAILSIVFWQVFKLSFLSVQNNETHNKKNDIPNNGMQPQLFTVGTDFKTAAGDINSTQHGLRNG